MKLHCFLLFGMLFASTGCQTPRQAYYKPDLTKQQIVDETRTNYNLAGSKLKYTPFPELDPGRLTRKFTETMINDGYTVIPLEREGLAYYLFKPYKGCVPGEMVYLAYDDPNH